jgi:putative flippase GtrA
MGEGKARGLLRRVIDRSMGLFRYFEVGLVAALTEWLVFGALDQFLRLHYVIAVIIAFFIATLVNYVLSIRWAFNSGRHAKHVEITLVYVVSGVGLVLNIVLMYLIHERLHVHAMVSKVICTGIVFFWNYWSRKAFVFNGRGAHGEGENDGE